jgi:hypothetical protein
MRQPSFGRELAELAATFRFDYISDTISIPDDPNAEPDDVAQPAVDLDGLIAEECEKNNETNSRSDELPAGTKGQVHDQEDRGSHHAGNRHDDGDDLRVRLSGDG